MSSFYDSPSPTTKGEEPLFLILSILPFAPAETPLTQQQLERLHARIPQENALSKDRDYSWEEYNRLEKKFCVYRENGKLKQARCGEILNRRTRRFQVYVDAARYIEPNQVAAMIEPDPATRSESSARASDRVEVQESDR